MSAIVTTEPMPGSAPITVPIRTPATTVTSMIGVIASAIA